ncbi:metallophosphoesterase [Pedobacter sp.]|uniref:metallophosphoesterase n=1 Tax=Pedobacter sp. TaxID=1411316 RepID=UPI003D7FA683
MKKLLLFLLILCCVEHLQAQQDESILSRIIFIGDAGEIHAEQTAVIKHAAAQIIKGKTQVMFLGDNIYPKGMGLPGSAEEEQTKNILRSQFQPMRKNGAPVYFIPGNHDWDDSGRNGLAKIKRQWAFLKEQNDSQLKMVPPNGCPDPIEIKVSPKLTMIVFDSEWWLFPHDKENAIANCDCNSKEAVLARFRRLKEQNKDKVILLLSHHPFQSYGAHGGYFRIPIIGDIYRAVRLALFSREDLPHPRYREMIDKISGIFNSAPNVIYVAGHEHGLQLIKSKKIQIISGSASKKSSVFKGENSLFASNKPGYVIADLMPGQMLKLTFFNDKGTGIKKVFTHIINTNASHKARSQ